MIDFDTFDYTDIVNFDEKIPYLKQNKENAIKRFNYYKKINQ